MPERGHREHWEQARRCTSHASPQDTAAASVGKLCLETWVEIAQVTTQKPLEACLPAFTLSQLCFLIDDVLTTGWPQPSLRNCVWLVGGLAFMPWRKWGPHCYLPPPGGPGLVPLGNPSPGFLPFSALPWYQQDTLSRRP